MTAINGVKLKVQEAVREDLRRNMAILPWRERDRLNIFNGNILDVYMG
jgi:hypothetical protein